MPVIPYPLSHLRSSGLAMEQHLRGRTIAQSEGAAWQDIEAQIIRRPSQEDGVMVPAVAEPLLVWIISGEARVEERELDGEWHGGTVRAGSFYLTHADAPYLMRWQAHEEPPFEVMHLYLGHALIERGATALDLNPARLRLRDVSGAQDALVSGLMTGLSDELQRRRPANPLFVNGLAASLTVHLLRLYADRAVRTGRSQAQLPAWKLRKVLEYMDAHLAEPFDLDRIADICGMSRYHFSRAFHNTIGHSPSRWFIRRRIERAMQMLRETEMRIIEIAMAVGYDSPSHFAQIFRRETGVPPGDYRAA